MENNNQRYIPKVSPTMYHEVSNVRRDMLEGEVKKGLFKDGSSRSQIDEGTHLGNVLAGTISKQANFESSSHFGNAFKGNSGSALMQNQEMYSPLWLNSNMSLPRDRITINAWCRSFYALNPIVQNAINLHSTYPIGRMDIRCHNKEVENFFNEMIEEIDLINTIIQMSQEYWLLGETFPMGELDQSAAKWSRFVIQNPDYMIVKRSVIPGEPNIFMKPDENLKRVCSSNAPSDISQRQSLDPTIVNYVKRGQNIPLDNYYVSHLARKISPYETHGVGLPVCIFRNLQLFDQIYESKFAMAEEMINPWRIFKIGGGNSDFRASPVDLESWRQTVEQAAANKNYKIFTHDAVSIETIGAGQGIYDTSGDIDRLLKFMYAGLFVPQIVIEGGGDITYANGGISLEVLRNRYMQFRNMIAAWIKRKVFAPIAKLNDFYDTIDGKKKLIIPEVEFNRMQMFDLNDYIQNIKDLSGDQKRVSVHTLYNCLGLDWETEKNRIRQEDIEEAIRKKEKESLESMGLSALRALGPDSEIPEMKTELSSGMETPSSSGAGLPGMDMGTPPPPPPSA